MWKRVAFALLCLVVPAGAGVQVFDPNKDLPSMQTGVMMTFLILFTIIFEYLTHKLNHITQEHHHAFVELVAKIYKEIMILGFISFTLTMCLQLEQTESGTTYVAATRGAYCLMFVVYVAHPFTLPFTHLTLL